MHERVGMTNVIVACHFCANRICEGKRFPIDDDSVNAGIKVTATQRPQRRPKRSRKATVNCENNCDEDTLVINDVKHEKQGAECTQTNNELATCLHEIITNSNVSTCHFCSFAAPIEIKKASDEESGLDFAMDTNSNASTSTKSTTT